jgi:hypothetical protein
MAVEAGGIVPVKDLATIRLAPLKSGSKVSTDLQELYTMGAAIIERKNHDYTGGDGDPYANFRGSVSLGISPILGILLRVQDKLMRIKTFDDKGELKVKGESVTDALVDVGNYMALIYGLVKEKQGEDIR